MILSLAPMQGYTDAVFRRAHYSFIGGVDRYYSPYFKVENEGLINAKYIRDISPEKNQEINLIPQILTNKTKDFNIAIPLLAKMGYNELNWNLGCPYPMVSKHQLGSGLLPYPEMIDSILSEIDRPAGFAISVKMRAGYLKDYDFYTVIKILNKHQIKEVIFHPRIGKQLYKGNANSLLLKPVTEYSIHPVAYNGDICTYEDAIQIHSTYPSINHLMIGRGLLYNPFLAKEINQKKSTEPEEKRVDFQKFHHFLIEQYQQQLSGPGHLLTKMIFYWEYFSHLYINQHRIYKEIKKCRTFEDFNEKSKRIIAFETFSAK
jgi:tRNA-dihydrouridine synthase B